jgi:hypothetical protein
VAGTSPAPGGGGARLGRRAKEVLRNTRTHPYFPQSRVPLRRPLSTGSGAAREASGALVRPERCSPRLRRAGGTDPTPLRVLLNRGPEVSRGGAVLVGVGEESGTQGISEALDPSGCARLGPPPPLWRDLAE